MCVGVAQVVARRLIPADQLRHADRLRGRRGAKREVAEALEEVEARLGELDDMRKRLAEVEERLDFAERLLTKQREAERIVPPQS